MKTSVGFFLSLFLLIVAPLTAQEKVAEGDYQATWLHGRDNRHWVLTTDKSGGYLVRTEMDSPKEGIRVVQLEELDSRLAPTSIGYELYLKSHPEPDVTVKCSLVGDSITCDGKSEKGVAPRSQPYRYPGPFLFTVEGLSRSDLAWLIASALNMAHLDRDKVPLGGVHLTGGAALELTDEINIATLQASMTPNQKLTAVRPENFTEWQFLADDDEAEMLSFAGLEDVKVGEATVAAQHYTLTSDDMTMNFWRSPSGLLLKMSTSEGLEFVLSGYRQYRKLIPEIKVEGSGKN